MCAHSIYKSIEGKKRIQNRYETYLGLLEADFDRVDVDTRFGCTHTLVTGPKEAKPVFIFQGGNCINPMTLSWFSSLFGEYRIYAPDTIGHPGYSAETRVSAKDESFALWISDLMEHFQVKQSAFIGPSFGGGIILRLAAFMPEKIACSILVEPAGLTLGSKVKMIRDILLPMIIFNMSSSPKQLQKIADAMSERSMKEIDRDIIGDIFKYVKLEQDMPKLTDKRELEHYHAPTLVIAGKKDIFFPGETLIQKSKETITNLETCIYDCGHFPNPKTLSEMNEVIRKFLSEKY